MINIEWDMLVLLNYCLSNSPEKFRTIIFLYTLHISLVLILWHLLLLHHYLLRVICLDMWDLYDASTDGEHQEEQPGRRGPATTSSSHFGAADDDVDTVASADGLEHAEHGHGNGNGNAPPQVRDKREEFLKGHPPIFKHSTDPL